MDLEPEIVDAMYAVVWCESNRGLISYTCKPPSNLPMPYPASECMDYYVVADKDDLFDILTKRDGTRVCFLYELLNDYLGWTPDA